MLTTAKKWFIIIAEKLPEIRGMDLTKAELLKRIGCVEQIGGVRDFTYNDGKAKGVRAIEINTGKLRFTVLPDRCMDIAQAYYEGTAISWLSKTGITAPQYYEKDEKNWLRGFYGGLITSCGLRNIGKPLGEHGLHGRIANTPAEKVSVTADWEGDEYVMRVSGIMRESAVFGENLVLKRTVTAKLFDDFFTVEDTLINEGFRDEKIAFCYHCNFGYPLVTEGARIVNVPESAAQISAPVHGIKEECIAVEYTDPMVTVGIENESIGAYLTYRPDTLPDFLVWRMLGESEYVVGLEPRTTRYGGENIVKHDSYVTLHPMEEYRTYLKFEVKNLR